MDDSHREMFEKWGSDRLRLMLQSGQVLPPMLPDALDWLSAQEERNRAKVEASRILSLQMEQSNRKMDISARNAAVAAAIFAALNTVITLLAWIFPRSPH